MPKKVSPIWYERAKARVTKDADLMKYKHILLYGVPEESRDHWKWIKRTNKPELIKWAQRIEARIKQKVDAPARKVSEDRYGRIVNLAFVFQRRPRPGDEKRADKIAGFREAQFKLATFEKNFPVDIPLGPGNNGSQITERVIMRYVNKHATPGKYEYYYVIAKFENSNGETFFRTITPRTEIPQIRLRNV